MDYSAHYQQQAYDPSSMAQQYYDQYSYSYANPQYANVQQYPYQNVPVQPSQHEEQEPNPPGVAAPLPPQQGQNPYYQYPPHGAAAVAPAVHAVGPQQGGVDAGVPLVHQPIAQPSYGGYGAINGVAPQGGPHTHVGPRPNVSSRPYRGRGRGRGRGLHKHASSPAQNQTVFTQGRSNAQGGPSQPVPGSNASHFTPTPLPFQGPAHAVPAVLPPKHAWCDLCRVDCNTLEILEQHKNGKKHKKKVKVLEDLQKLNKAVIIDPPMVQAPAPEVKPEFPSQQLLQESLPSEATNEESKAADENQTVEQVVEPTEESGKNVATDQSQGVGRGLKRKMRGGKTSRKTKPFGRAKRVVEPPKPKEVIPLVCELCNVKCESPVVFQSHLVGKKHLAKAKLFLSQHEALGQVVLQALGPALQALNQQNAIASTSIAPQLHYQGFGAYQGTSTSDPNADNTNVGAQIVMNEGHPESGLESNCPTGVATGSQLIPSGTTLDGASVSEHNAVAVPGQDSTTGQVQTEGKGQAQ